jgi:hypothetical protein
MAASVGQVSLKRTILQCAVGSFGMDTALLKDDNIPGPSYVTWE